MHRLLIALLGLLVITSFSSCWSQDAESRRVLGLVRETKKWKRFHKVPYWRTTTFYYQVEGTDELKAWQKKLRGVRDLRKYEDRFPIRNWIQQTAHRWSPVTNSAAALAIPVIQGWTNQRGTK